MQFFFEHPFLFLLIFFACAILFIAFRPIIRGKIGETSVQAMLAVLPQEEYTLFHDVLFMADSRSVQVDHIVVSRYGIFVIETKNYSGWIYGTDYGNEWTQAFHKKKYRFHNPLLQNYGHVKSLETLLSLPLDCFIPIVAFTTASTLKVKTKQPVVYTVQLRKTILAHREEKLTNEQVALICDKIRSIRIDSKEARKEHVTSIRDNIADTNQKLADGICPKCGGVLVKRNGKYGAFLGCKNYPNCKFTKQLK